MGLEMGLGEKKGGGSKFRILTHRLCSVVARLNGRAVAVLAITGGRR